MQSSDNVQKIIPSLQVIIWKLKQVLLATINTFIWVKPNLSIYMFPFWWPCYNFPGTSRTTQSFWIHCNLLQEVQRPLGEYICYYTALFSMHCKYCSFFQSTLSSNYGYVILVLDTGKQVTCNNNFHEKKLEDYLSPNLVSQVAHF